MLKKSLYFITGLALVFMIFVFPRLVFKEEASGFTPHENGFELKFDPIAFNQKGQTGSFSKIIIARGGDQIFASMHANQLANPNCVIYIYVHDLSISADALVKSDEEVPLTLPGSADTRYVVRINYLSMDSLNYTPILRYAYKANASPSKDPIFENDIVYVDINPKDVSIEGGNTYFKSSFEPKALEENPLELTFDDFRRQFYDESKGYFVDVAKNFFGGDALLISDTLTGISFDEKFNVTTFRFASSFPAISEHEISFQGDLRKTYAVGDPLKLNFKLITLHQWKYLKSNYQLENQVPKLEDYLVTK